MSCICFLLDRSFFFTIKVQIKVSFDGFQKQIQKSEKNKNLNHFKKCNCNLLCTRWNGFIYITCILWDCSFFFFSYFTSRLIMFDFSIEILIMRSRNLFQLVIIVKTVRHNSWIWYLSISFCSHSRPLSSFSLFLVLALFFFSFYFIIFIKHVSWHFIDRCNDVEVVCGRRHGELNLTETN